MNEQTGLTVGTGFDTYEVLPRVAAPGWQVYRAGNVADTFIGFYPTKAAALKEAKRLAGVD